MLKRMLPLVLVACAALFSADFKFLIYSDVQGGGEGNHRKLPGIISRIPGGVSFAVTTGDNAGLGNYDTAQATTWDTFLSTALNLGVPFWPCRGNHDGVEDAAGVTLSNWKNTMSFIQTRPEYQSGSPNNDYYSFMVNNCLFVVLNNMNGTKAPETTWISNEVRTSRALNADHIFVFLHYAMLSPNTPDSIQPNYRWEKYITPYFENMPNLAGVFWGDRHWFWKGDYKGITGVLVPATTATRAAESEPGPGELAGSFSGYLVLNIKGDSVTAKAYDYAEAERASFVVKGYDPFDSMAVVGIQGIAEPSTIEQYLQTRVKAAVTYENLQIDTTYGLEFASLDPALASVDTLGWATGLAVGTARIRVTKKGVSDTVSVTVTASTAVLDSLRLSVDSMKLFVQDTFQAHVTGYYHVVGQSFLRIIDSEAVWATSSASLATVAYGRVVGAAAGAPVFIVASMGAKADSCRFSILPKPSFLMRVNFRTDTIPHAAGWRADNGTAYTEARKIGWVSPSSMTPRADRNNGPLLGSFVASSLEKNFRIAAPDGEYVLKIGVGDNKYGGLCTVAHEGEMLVNHSAVANAIVEDTVSVAGGTGLLLTVTGKICYLVAISSEGIPMDMLANDGGLALIAPVPPPMGCGYHAAREASSVSVHPNPCNPSAVLDFAGPGLRSIKTVRIYNATGQVVEAAVLGPEASRFVWNGFRQPSGLYLIKIVVDKGTFQTRVMLMR